MDIASLVGFLGAVGMILMAMISGGGIGPFIDTPSILIVFGGTFFAVMYTTPLGNISWQFWGDGKSLPAPDQKI